MYQCISNISKDVNIRTQCLALYHSNEYVQFPDKESNEVDKQLSIFFLQTSTLNIYFCCFHHRSLLLLSKLAAWSQCHRAGARPSFSATKHNTASSAASGQASFTLSVHLTLLTQEIWELMRPAAVISVLRLNWEGWDWEDDTYQKHVIICLISFGLNRSVYA